jgi:chemotaxis protein methyltransferase CheR
VVEIFPYEGKGKPVKSTLTGLENSEHFDIGDDELAEIGMILEMRRKFSMSVYKDKCMKRRVAIRMRSCRCTDAAAYCNLLRQSEQELDLLKRLTIHKFSETHPC